MDSAFLLAVKSIVSYLLNLLPDSPFTFLNQSSFIQPYLETINWIIPFSFIVSTLEVWLIAVVSYFVWSLILRWIRAIE